MDTATIATCTAFAGPHRIASGPLRDVALATKQAIDAGAAEPILVFDDATGRTVEIDFRGTVKQVTARLDHAAGAAPSAAPRGPGRPRLGVTAREVTLLPRHWEWLAGQPGGASAALRRLVEDARRHGGARERARRADEAADRVLRTLAGDFAGYEEASRAFWRGERKAFAQRIAAWPADVREHVQHLAAIAWDERGAS